MNIYLSSFTVDALKAYIALFPHAVLNILVSFGLRNESMYSFLHEYKDNINSIVLDSGAFTKNSAKSSDLRAAITFCGYKAFLQRYAGHFDYCFNFDENFEAEYWYENQVYLDQLHAEGHSNVVPVVHSYTEEEVECYLRKGYPIIALGFSEQHKNPANIRKLSHMIHDAGAKVHVLGVSTWNGLANAPIAYCDSSSWIQHSMYGTLLFWNEARADSSFADCTDRIKFVDKTGKTPRSPHYYHDYEYADTLSVWLYETFGWEYYELMNPDNFMKRTLVNIHYFVELQRRITAHYNQLGFAI